MAPISSFYNSLLCLVARTGGASLVKCNNEYEIWHSQTEYTYQVYTLAIVAKDLSSPLCAQSSWIKKVQ